MLCEAWPRFLRLLVYFPIFLFLYFFLFPLSHLFLFHNLFLILLFLYHSPSTSLVVFVVVVVVVFVVVVVVVVYLVVFYKSPLLYHRAYTKYLETFFPILIGFSTPSFTQNLDRLYCTFLERKRWLSITESKMSVSYHFHCIFALNRCTFFTYVTMNNLGDELTHVNFSCVLVIFKCAVASL